MLHTVFYEGRNTLDGKLLSSWPLFHTQPGRNGYFLNLQDYPDSILNAFTHTFSSSLKSCFTLNISFLLCFSLNSQSFIILLPSFSTAGLFFMVLCLVILPLYCFLSELLSRIRQLAYHRDMIYWIYKWHSPCGATLILFDFGKISCSRLLSSKTYYSPVVSGSEREGARFSNDVT